MIILDTNVASEAMKPDPNPSVCTWLNDQNKRDIYITSITLAELKYGIFILPEGHRKTMLKVALNEFSRIFNNEILPFDSAAATEYATLALKARRAGKGFPTPDGYIAAITKAKGFIIASRDTAPFKAAEVPIINPWDLS